MDGMRISIDRRAVESFGAMLRDAGVPFEHAESRPKIGEVYCSTGDILTIASDASWPAVVATVLIAWIHGLRNRKAIITTKDHQVVHVETSGMSADDVSRLLADAKSLMILELPENKVDPICLGPPTSPEDDAA
jgi:hypothetical protein